MDDLEEVIENQQKTLEGLELPGFCATKNQDVSFTQFFF